MLTVRRWRNTILDGQKGIEGLWGVTDCADGVMLAPCVSSLEGVGVANAAAMARSIRR